jgi:hypothetical protein
MSKVSEDTRKSGICILGTKTREMMNESKILGVIVVATSSLIVWGFNVSVQCGHFEKRIHVI